MQFRINLRSFLLAIALLCSGLTMAQIPKLISYQGLLTDNNGAVLADGNYNVTVKIFDAQTGGSELWSENHSINVTNGLFQVALGSNTALNIPFDNPYFVSTTVNGTELLPRMPMTASPYALNTTGGGDGGSGKAYALDAFGGGLVDVVLVDEDGNVGINQTPIFGVQTAITGRPENIVALVARADYTEENAIGVEATAIGNEDSGTGGRFRGNATGVVGLVPGQSRSNQAKIGVNGFSSGGGSGDNIGVSGTASSFGGTAYGVRGVGNGSGFFNYGVFGTTEDGTAGFGNYAIYGKAKYEVNHWAGYFEGNGYVDNYFSVGVEDVTSLEDRGVVIQPSIGLRFQAGSDIASTINQSGTSLIIDPNNTTYFNKGIHVFNYDWNFERPYAIQAFGGPNGLSVTLDGSTDSNNQFIYFADADGMQGAITGQTSLGDVASAFGGLITGFVDNLLAAPSLDRSGSVDPFATNTSWSSQENSVNTSSEINGADDSQFGAILGNFAQETFTPEYLIELVLLSIDAVRNTITFATSFSSILDPEDIFSKGLDALSSGVSLGAYLGFALSADGVAYESGAGDYAEWLIRADSTEMISYGDIVGVKAGVISRKFNEADHYMAISTAPAVIGNMPQPGVKHLYEKVAFMGQIPVKVSGIVEKGDYIVPSGNGDGIGIAVNPTEMLARDYHRIIGIAWDEADGSEPFALINTAVGINQNDLADIVDHMQTVMNDMQRAIQEINPDYQPQLFNTNGNAVMVANGQGMDYTVAPTHPSQIAGLFSGESYATQAEAIAAVKDAWQQTANIDITEHPHLNYILEHPGQVNEIVAHYSAKLAELEAFAKKLATANSDD